MQIAQSGVEKGNFRFPPEKFPGRRSYLVEKTLTPCEISKGGMTVTRDDFCEAAWTELQNVEQGTVTIQMKGGDILSGPVKYQTSTGWTIVAFSDGDVWDYVRKMISPTGEAFEIWPERQEDDCEGFRRIRAYHPPPEQLRDTWGFMC